MKSNLDFKSNDYKMVERVSKIDRIKIERGNWTNGNRKSRSLHTNKTGTQTARIKLNKKTDLTVSWLKIDKVGHKQKDTEGENEIGFFPLPLPWLEGC